MRCKIIIFNVKNSIFAFSTEHESRLYKHLFNEGFTLYLDNGASMFYLHTLIETYLPLGIILGVALALLLVVCVMCNSVLLKGNFKSMAIMSGLGAKAHHTAIIAGIMVAILSVIILAFAMPIAFGLNALYNFYNNIGMAIGVVEVLVSIGVVLCVNLVSVAVCTILLRRKKIVDSLRVE